MVWGPVLWGPVLWDSNSRDTPVRIRNNPFHEKGIQSESKWLIGGRQKIGKVVCFLWEIVFKRLHVIDSETHE